MASTAADRLASGLEQDAVAWEQGRLENLDRRMQAIQQQVLPINDIPRPSFKLAMRFLKEWQRALTLGACYHGPVQASDWPIMARTIARHVRTGTLPDDRRILQYFVRRRPVLNWRDVKRLFGSSD